MSHYLGAREQPEPEPPDRGHAAVTVTVLALIALVGSLFAAGVIQFGAGSDPADPGTSTQPGATGALTIEVATQLAAAADGTCHAVCQLDYRRQGPADDAKLEALRPKLQRMAIEIIRRGRRSDLATDAGLAELERQLLHQAIETLQDTGAEIANLKVVGMRFEN